MDSDRRDRHSGVGRTQRADPLSLVHEAARRVLADARYHDGEPIEFRIAVAASRYAHGHISRAGYDPRNPPQRAEESLAAEVGLCGQASQAAADIARRLGVAAQQIGFRFTMPSGDRTHVGCEFWIDGAWRYIDVQNLAYWAAEDGVPLPIDEVQELGRRDRARLLVADFVSLRFFPDADDDPFAYLDAEETWVLTREDMQPDGTLEEVAA